MSKARPKTSKDQEMHTGLPVFWKESSSSTICRSVAVSVEDQLDGRKIVRFADGGWNPAESCFFTEEQCRRYHGLLPPKLKENHTVIARKLEIAAQELRAL